MQHIPGKILLLNGGGFDSSAQLIIGSKHEWDITSLHIDYGQTATSGERGAVMKFSAITKTPAIFVNMSRTDCTYNSQGDSYTGIRKLLPDHPMSLYDPFKDVASFEVVGRNLMLIAIAQVVAQKEFSWILIANNADTTYADTSMEFSARVNQLLQFLGIQTRVISPLNMLRKGEAVLEAYKIDKRILEAHTCYRAVECGVCPHCQLKAKIVENVHAVMAEESP